MPYTYSELKLKNLQFSYRKKSYEWQKFYTRVLFFIGSLFLMGSIFSAAVYAPLAIIFIYFGSSVTFAVGGYWSLLTTRELKDRLDKAMLERIRGHS